MCGIYCSLKCNKSDASCGSSREDPVLHTFMEYLKHRGPDGFSEYKVNIGSKWTANFAGCVLWMQGSELTLQPSVDDKYNTLLWNGDVFSGLMVNQETSSDTKKISQTLTKINGIEIPAVLSSIQGPYAFIYLDVQNHHLYFGRDRLGRHSLLWSSDCEGGLVLTSVGKRNVLNFKEVPAIGIFRINMNSDLEKITLYPWSDIAAEMLQNIDQDSVLKVEVSSETIQSPITALGRHSKEELFDSEHLLNQYNTKVLTGVHEIRDFIEKLQSSSDIKNSVKKLVSLLRSSVRVRVQTHPGICKECLECARHLRIETHMSKNFCKCSGLEYQQHFLQCSTKSALYGEQLSGTSCTKSEDSSISSCSENTLIVCHNCSTSLEHADVKECPHSTSARSCEEMWTGGNPKLCHHSKIGILFSGGLDSTILAGLADEFVPLGEPIDLLNVAFERERKNGKPNRKQAREKNHLDSTERKKSSYLVPDRITGKRALDDLKRLYPNRQWNFVQIDVTQEELIRERDRIISDLIYPLNTVLDESLGCALWFASRGKGCLVQQNGAETHYSSPARVLLLGMGADELFGGYKRHRTALNLKGWHGLRNELQLDLDRISTRNLGRDDRIVSDHGCQGRLPYLDESVVSYVSSLQPWQRCCPKPEFPPGVGDKLLLRLVAWQLGLHYAAGLPKRAFQFGSRIANSKERANDVSSRL